MIDNDLSWRLVPILAAHGVEAIHVRDLGLAHAPDDLVLPAAVAHGRVLVTRDGDFARMLAASGSEQPSVLLLRSQVHDRPAEQAPMLIAALRSHGAALLGGAVVVVEDDAVRVRPLPLVRT